MKAAIRLVHVGKSQLEFIQGTGLEHCIFGHGKCALLEKRLLI
jgi:hypothetical protein